MILSIIIPVYNEKKTILKVLNSINSVKLENLIKEVIVVDDFSIDGTREVVKSLKKCKTLFHDKNYGKGQAIRSALSIARGDVVLIQDADLEYNPKYYDMLIKPIIEGEADAVYGSRFLGKRFRILGPGHIILPLHYIGNKLLTRLTNLLFKSDITDMETGYKVFRSDVLKRIKLVARGFEFEPEVTAKLLKNNYKIKEVPISTTPRDFNDGKKITWADGLKAGYYLIKYRFIG